MSIRLLVIDGGSSYVADLLRALTPESGVEVAGRATDLVTLIESAWKIDPDVVLVDAELVRDGNGSEEYLSKVPELFPDAHIFIVAPRAELDALQQAQKRPAIGMIANDAQPQDVVAAIRHAGDGTVLLHRDFVPNLEHKIRYFRRRHSPSGSPLTPRETQVISMLSRGVHVDGIARSLSLSVHTVRGHVKNILAKLDSHSQLEAVAKAKDRGWVPG